MFQAAEHSPRVWLERLLSSFEWLRAPWVNVQKNLVNVPSCLALAEDVLDNAAKQSFKHSKKTTSEAGWDFVTLGDDFGPAGASDEPYPIRSTPFEALNVI